MKGFEIVLCMFLAVFWIGAHSQQTKSVKKNDIVEVKVYYEALCIDSIRFVIRQLQPSMIAKERLDYTDLQLIPYGKVWKFTNETTGEIELTCQHGYKECELNALHACIIENNYDFETLNVIVCLMSSVRSDFDQCTAQTFLNTYAVKQCMKDRTIPEILDKYGKETDAINIQFVPSIGIDKEFNENQQDELRTDFDKVFCRVFTKKYNYTLPNC